MTIKEIYSAKEELAEFCHDFSHTEDRIFGGFILWFRMNDSHVYTSISTLEAARIISNERARQELEKEANHEKEILAADPRQMALPFGDSLDPQV